MKDYSADYKGKKVLVTGGAGAIGSNLSKALAELGAQVIILDDFSSAEKWNVPSHQNILLVEGNICDEIKLKRAFFEKPDYVFHLAAFFANQNSLDHPESDLKTNGFGTLKLLEYAQLSGLKRFVYASSGCSIYGSSAPLPLKEDFMSMHLTTPYQITKMLGELYCNFFHHHYDVPVVKTRFFNSYGPGEIPGQYRNVIPNFIYWAMRGMPLPITGTGEATRDFTYVGDLVNGLIASGIETKAIGEEFNLASEKETRIIDLANMINKRVGNSAGVLTAPKRKWDTKSRLLASVDKARKLIGYESDTPFENGLDSAIKWFKDNWENIEKAASFGPGASAAVKNFVTKK